MSTSELQAKIDAMRPKIEALKLQYSKNHSEMSQKSKKSGKSTPSRPYGPNAKLQISNQKSSQKQFVTRPQEDTRVKSKSFSQSNSSAKIQRNSKA